MSMIAIIPARGGSKRIPKKNIRDFCGKPIIAYSIEAALESGLFDEVMVSTDSEEIAETAKRYGAAVPFLRSEETSSDYATTADVIAEVMEAYVARGRAFDAFACLYATAPFVTAAKLRGAERILTETGADGVVAVARFSFPPQRAFLIENDCVRYAHPEYRNARSQDLAPVYHDCGQFYFCKTEAFAREHSLITERTAAYPVPEEEAQDIDTAADWAIAEAKYRVLHEGAK